MVIRSPHKKRIGGGSTAPGKLLKTKKKKIINISPGYMKARGANAATEGGGGGGNWTYFAFDKDTDEYTQCVFQIPEDYDGGEINAVIYWTSNTTSGNCKWLLGYNSKEPGEDRDATGFTTGQLGLDSAPGTADIIKQKKILINYVTEIVIKPNDIVAMEIRRQASHGTDTMAGDAFLLHMSIEYTANL